MLPDPEVRKYVQKALGQSLTGEIPEQAIYINYGVGENGKSTFFDTIRDILADYAGSLPVDVLTAKRDATAPAPALVGLRGKRLIVLSESEDGQRFNEALIKRLTGDKTLTARNLYSGEIEFDITHKMFLHVNHKPDIKGTDHAIWRRIKLIPWTFKVAKKDKHLLKKLQEEKSGILNWLLVGLKLYQAEGLDEPQTILAATEEYRSEMDRVNQFISECCEIPETALYDTDTYYVKKDELYEAYRTWCIKSGMFPLSKNNFGTSLVEGYGFDKKSKKKERGKEQRVWFGIRLT